jgi:hypothetical protein
MRYVIDRRSMLWSNHETHVLLVLSPLPQAQLAAELVPRFWTAVSAAGSDDPAAGLDAVLARSLEVRLVVFLIEVLMPVWHQTC